MQLTKWQLDGDRFGKRDRLSLSNLVLSRHTESVVISLEQLGHCELSLVCLGVADLQENIMLQVSFLYDVPFDRCPAIVGGLIPHQQDRVLVDGCHSQVLRSPWFIWAHTFTQLLVSINDSENPNPTHGFTGLRLLLFNDS